MNMWNQRGDKTQSEGETEQTKARQQDDPAAVPAGFLFVFILITVQ